MPRKMAKYHSSHRSGCKVFDSKSEVTVWVVNSNGSQTPVRLTRRGTGYIGFKVEYYHIFPTNEQLRMVYGF